MRVAKHAAVHESVNLAAKEGRKVLGFANAVLRKVAELNPEKISYPDLDRDPVRHLSVRYSYPLWLVARWLERFGFSRTEFLLKEGNVVPPLTLRANRLWTTRERLIEEFARRDIRALPCRVSPDGVIVSGGEPGTLPRYKEGWFYVQDEGAQLVSHLLGVRPGEVILDACAAPGGKATHLAEMMGDRGEVVALDVDRERLAKVEENVRRLRVGIIQLKTTLADFPPSGYDRILIDAPCSALGVLRRAPEGKWRKREGLIRSYRKRQIEILERTAPLVREGGVVVYSTCSTEPQENEEVIAAFLAAHQEFAVENAAPYLPAAAAEFVTPEGFFSTLFNRDRMDRFFSARLIRRGVEDE